MPAYVLMTFDLSAKGYKALENLWRTFIWGTREDGTAKKSSVAWDVMQKSKIQGGARILDLSKHSTAVKVRQVSRLLEGKELIWTLIAHAFIQQHLAAGKHRAEMRCWMVEEAILLGPKMKLKTSTTLQHLLQAWYKVCWTHKISRWKSLMSNEMSSTTKLNRKWRTEQSDETWNMIWQFTWKRPSIVREGFWWWRTMWQGFWSGQRAAKVNVSTGLCPRCLNEVETVEHLFWSCPHSIRRWTRLEQVTSGTGCAFSADDGWLQFKLNALRLKPTYAALWAIAAEMYKIIWRERTDKVFRNVTSHRPLRSVLKETVLSVSSWLAHPLPDQQHTLTERTLESIQVHLEALETYQGRLRMPHDPGVDEKDVETSSELEGGSGGGSGDRDTPCEGTLSDRNHEEYLSRRSMHVGRPCRDAQRLAASDDVDSYPDHTFSPSNGMLRRLLSSSDNQELSLVNEPG
ncbi:hypothetical protein R1sor_011385 [Riccia sorocarpa]|uniref:Reverse transcriptase zinc-binding domain-containing protein n=1 Tax=Riccia sorocarpa TaxID=122646 RepID=A0ABD3I6S6_9MARC